MREMVVAGLFRQRILGLATAMMLVVAIGTLEAQETEWASLYNGPGNDADLARFVGMDPSSGRVYVSGFSIGGGTGLDYATIAYDASGTQLWVARYNGNGNGSDRPFGMAVDASTGNVYVTGRSDGGSSSDDYATVAYDASGTQLWVARYNGPGNKTDGAFGVAVDSASGTVYVTGFSHGGATSTDYLTVAYDASGTELWTARYNGPANRSDSARAITLNPSTGNVCVTGVSNGGSTHGDMATVAYDALGSQLWVTRYEGPGADAARAIAVDPESGRVFVTGESDGGSTAGDYATIAYDASGSELWAARYNGPGNGADRAADIAVDPASGNVYATGFSTGVSTFPEFATVAYDPSGTELWVARYAGSADGTDSAQAVALDPAGNIYVTGPSDSDSATIAYDPSGTQLWEVRYNGPDDGLDGSVDIAVDPSSGSVYLAGNSFSTDTLQDYAILKISTRRPPETVLEEMAVTLLTMGALGEMPARWAASLARHLSRVQKSLDGGHPDLAVRLLWVFELRIGILHWRGYLTDAQAEAFSSGVDLILDWICPSEELDAVIVLEEHVLELEAEGGLTSRAAAALLSRLRLARRSLNACLRRPATFALAQFIRLTDRFARREEIDEEDARDLIESAGLILESLDS